MAMMRWVLAAAVLLGALALRPGAVGATDAVVSAPCGEAEFDAALAVVQSSGGGTITFDCDGAATITFTAQKEITSEVRIDGAGQITLSGGDATRHFWVYPGGRLSLERIVLADGHGTDGLAGAIFVEGGGTLHLTGSTLRGNRSEYAGAVYLHSAEQPASATITNSSLVENEAYDGSAGALYVEGGVRDSDLGASVTITDSLLADNVATGSGGAILIAGGYYDQASGGVVTVTNSELLRNTAGSSGGAIVVEGGSFDDSTGASLTVVASTLAGNSAESVGGAIYIDGGTFENSTGGAVEIRRSTLSGNRSFGAGGAIYAHGGRRDLARGGTLSLKNSTVSGNEATNRGGGLYVLGGTESGTSGGEVQILASTITANNSLGNLGDGLYIDPRAQAPQVTLRLSIVAENDTAAGGVDCQGPVLSNGRNLDSDNTCQLFRVHDVPGGEADLGPLADNGGPTLTHRPGANSDALDAGPETCMEIDQRELARPAGAACDIGAVEVQPVEPVTLCVDRFTGRVLAESSAGCDPAVTYEVVIPNAAPQTFCIDPFTAALTHAATGTCPPSRTPHVIPDDGDLLTCVHTFTGEHCVVSSHSQCSPVEEPFTIPA